MRSRNIKPDFFLDEDLAELPFETRLLFIGLWCAADREGRIEDRPKKLRAQIFPHDTISIEPMLAALIRSGHVLRYQSNEVNVLLVKGFKKHQSPHSTEKASELPDINDESTFHNGGPTLNNASTCVDIPLIPDSGLRIPDPGSRIPDCPTQPPAPRKRVAPPTLYRWEEFASTYPEKGLVLDAKAKSWWRKHVKDGDDMLVDEILVGTRAWCVTDQFTVAGAVWNSGKFLAEKIWQKVPTETRRQEEDPLEWTRSGR